MILINTDETIVTMRPFIVLLYDLRNVESDHGNFNIRYILPR